VGFAFQSHHAGHSRGRPESNAAGVARYVVTVDVPSSQTKPFVQTRTCVVAPPGKLNVNGSVSAAERPSSRLPVVTANAAEAGAT
jgi:hypothetical protein